MSALAHRGAAVILGRGAACIVSPGRRSGCSWSRRSVAPRAPRRDPRRCPPREAASRLAVEDQDRVEFHRRSFHFQRDDPTNYDLVIEHGHPGAGGPAASIIVDTLHRRFTRLEHEDDSPEARGSVT